MRDYPFLVLHLHSKNSYVLFLLASRYDNLRSQLQPATLQVQVNRPPVVDYIEIESIAKHLFQAPINEVHLHCEWQQQRKKNLSYFFFAMYIYTYK